MKNKKYYIFPENNYNDGIWSFNIFSKFVFEFWIGLKTWFKLNPQRVCTIYFELQDGGE